MINAFVGSERQAVAGATPTQPLDGATEVAFTVVLRRRTELVLGPDLLGAQDFADLYGADPDDVAAVSEALTGAGLTVADVDIASRRLQVTGPVAAAAEAFGTELSMTSSPDLVSGAMVAHRVRTGSLSLPAELIDRVVAVLGLDDRPQARTYFRLARAKKGTSYTLPQLEKAYAFPTGTDGTGETIAIVELGGGFGDSDLTSYFASIDVTPPTVRAVSVDRAKNVAGADPQGADGEVLLDIEVAGALAPKATVLVYFAPNTDRGFLDAISTAVHANPTPTAISISWGQSEDSWTAQARTAMDEAFLDAAALGVTVCVAAGDNGSGDNVPTGGKHVDFPASSPHALACGGTRLAVGSDGLPTRETVWNDGSQGGATGGGVSDVFALPAYQGKAGVPGSGRGVPDVAGNADPESGYQVFVDGQSLVIGGTSAVAPLWAALVARLAQGLGKPLGLLQPALYGVSSGLRDITSGDNGAYAAGPGWDACTGLGVPDGELLLAALRSTSG